MNEGYTNPLDKFKEVLPEGLKPEIGEKLLTKAQEDYDAGKSVEEIIEEYKTKRENATADITDKVVTIDSSKLTVENIEQA